MKKILVAVDGSDESQRAAKMAADVAGRFGCTLTLIHVIPPLLIPPDTYGFDVGSLLGDQEKAAEKLLRTAADRLEAGSLHVERIFAHGPPAETVARIADKEAFDLVVVGSRGRNAAARVLLGSVSDRLAHICEKPILIVR
jgi:nucleotide-binding universal stress UspA family protein